MRNAVLVLIGAAAGGALGYYAFFWIANQGYYGIMLPGGLLGLGAGVARNPSRWLPVACAVFALALGLFTEWQFAPFTKDESFTNFISHAHHLKPATLLMIAIGGVIAFWVPFRRLAHDANNTSAATM